MVQSFWKTVRKFPKVLNMRPSCDLFILFVNIYPTEKKTYNNLYINVHSSFICSSPKLETTQMSINSAMHGLFVGCSKHESTTNKH